jgi:hypothetical protein
VFRSPPQGRYNFVAQKWTRQISPYLDVGLIRNTERRKGASILSAPVSSVHELCPATELDLVALKACLKFGTSGTEWVAINTGLKLIYFVEQKHCLPQF